jgi:hypothetical protein
MTIWIDAQLSPALAPWISATFGIPAVAVRDLGLRDATDHQIFMAARQAGVIVMSKDSDFTPFGSIRHAAASDLVDMWQHFECRPSGDPHRNAPTSPRSAGGWRAAR